MGDKNKIYLIILLLWGLSLSEIQAQLSKTHYIPPLTSAEFGNANPESQYIYISTPSNNDIPYTIKPIGQPATNYITGTVSNANPEVVSVGFGYSQLFVISSQTSKVTSDKGYIIEAEDVIYVSVRMEAGGGAQAGALVSKGIAGLGNTFRVGSYTNENPGTNYLNFVSVMASEDNTNVTFSDLPAGISIKNYGGGLPINVTLDEGESYIVATNSSESIINRDGLIGTLVESDKPIAVNCGSANGSFSNGGGRDYGIDQIVSLEKVGKEYIFVEGDGTDAWENVLIVGHTDNTTISINGVSATTINAGDYYLIEGNRFSSFGNMYVETSKPVFAYQGIGATNSEANQGMFFVPPLSCENRGNLSNIADIENIGGTNYTGGVTIVTNTGATVTINDQPIGNFSTFGPYPVSGKSEYVTYKVIGLAGDISVQCDAELYCAYFNYNGAATSGSFYSGFPSKPEINFEAEFETLGNCIPNITLAAANTENFDTFDWLFDDGSGSGFVNLNNTNPEITPTIPGKYKLVGVVTCSGLVLESTEVPVSLCPDDIDVDGIIDNLDIDNDNDGILNCEESKGDVILNLQNENQPILNFSDGTSNSLLATGAYTQNSSSGETNTFMGSGNGSFQSIVRPANSAEGNYTISFSEPVNIAFDEDTSTNHNSTDGEFFIAKISPAEKNITLVDPDNRLLVDSNFDGIFESGANQISGSEIHFKINPNASGSTPYQFRADHVTSFSFIHKLVNINSTSTFNGILSLSCFAKDTDEDGIIDALDSDSDNDGIPDIVESTGGNYLPLSYVDDDINGLDDVFDLLSIPLDTDMDGVYDFYDLDSDNDGIYDLEESGSLLADTDFDGIVDDANANIGLNGWVDAAETAPDSGEISSMPVDTEGDLTFNYIDSDSDGDLCSDVLEAGFSDANGDDYLGDANVVVDQNGLVSNAGDGYTTPDPDYVTTAPISIITQPIDTEVCELGNTDLLIETSDIDVIQWQFSPDGVVWTDIADDNLYTNSATPTLNILNAPTSIHNYKYRASLDKIGNSCGLYSDEITLTVIDLPIAETAPVMQLCDDDNNGTMPFELTLQNALINTQPGMTISYHISQEDADTGNGPLTSPFESGNTTIFARVENDLNTNCIDTSSFELEVYESAFPLDEPNITNLGICDDLSIGTDTDGFVLFDLTQKETEILNGQSNTDFTLTYFTDSEYLNQIPTADLATFQNTISGGQTIYVRVTNNLNSDCFTDTSFDLEVYELPIIFSPTIYSQCDDESNDGFAQFNLTLDAIKVEIAPNYITENLSFSYYWDSVEAQIDGVSIPTPENYQNASSFVDEIIYIRVETPNGCFRVESITIEVTPSSVSLFNYEPVSVYKCDGGSNVRDGISTFDLTGLHDHISNVIFSTVTVTTNFYESQSDAELENNAITDLANHQNTNSPNSQDIWVRVKSDLGNNCLGLRNFPNHLNVEALPLANDVTINRQCDDDQDGFYPFNTSAIEGSVLNGQSLSDVTVTYFDENNNPLPSPLPNPFLTNSQTITIRLTNNMTNDPNGACFDETTLEFIVDRLPVANTVIVAEVCDDDDNDTDGLYDFDTSTIQSQLLGGQTGMEVHYFDQSGVELSSPLPNPFTSGSQTITAQVINPINKTCQAVTSFDLVVNPLPAFEVESEQIICESGPASTLTLNVDQEDPFELFDYEWTDQSGTILGTSSTLDIDLSGVYRVELTKTDGTDCARSKDITVVYSELANIDLSDLIIEDAQDNNTVTIINTVSNLGQGDYEFSLDDEFSSYRDEPFFDHVPAGIHTLYVRDKNGCGTSSLEISVIGFPRFFTPNNDGYNDTWKVLGVNENFYANSNIFIFDRYGKLISKIDTNGDGWNGLFNGKTLPSTDYWFTAELINLDGTIRYRKGHFSLIRR